MSAGYSLAATEISNSGIASGMRFRSLDLTSPSVPLRRFWGVSGRFGIVTAIAPQSVLPNDTPADVAQDPSPARVRVIRRLPVGHSVPDIASAAEPARSTMPHARAKALRTLPMSPVRAEARAGFWPAVVLMLLVWAGVVAVGAAFFNTPRSGFKVEWR